MVPFLCVIIINCVSDEISHKNFANLSTFASSNAASISSNTQKGLGFTNNIPNNKDIAVKAFSPPESNDRLCSFFPGGCAIISIPEFKTSFSSSKINSAFPPLKSLTKHYKNFFVSW